MCLINNITLAHIIILCNVRPSFYELQILMNNFTTNYDITRLLFYHRLNGM